MLFVVSTPIGNLEDLTMRALRVLRESDRIVAEDTRRTRQLLTHFAIESKRLSSFHAHSSESDLEKILGWLAAGESVALVTDAGTPLVSDPGDILVRRAIAAGVGVVPIPGASAILSALVASGLGGGAFRFFGFLPRSGLERAKKIGELCRALETCVLYESANRTGDTLAQLAEAMPQRAVCVSRELTKLHEEHVRGSLAEVARQGREWIGEVVIVLGAIEASPSAELQEEELDKEIESSLASGQHPKVIAELLSARSGMPKREVYARVVQKKTRR